MLRSLTSQLEVHLHSHCVAIATKRLGKRAEARQLIAVAPPSGAHVAGWVASLTVLDACLDAAPQSGASVEFVVSDHFVRYGLIPWSPDVQSSNEFNALGGAALHAIYGAMSAEWEIQVEHGGYRAAGLACAMEQALISKIAQLCDKHALRLRKMQPLSTQIFNRLRRTTGNDGLVAVVEHNRCILACIRNGAWHSIRALSVGLGAANALDVLIERELVLQGLDQDIPIHVHAVAGTDISATSRFFNAVLTQDLHWQVPAAAPAMDAQSAQA
ncbi:hypothetical protein [Massilia rubra]|uniref:Uncharacterized protein n=1 Tax=Massilia rubra TaxID=2607910 RepID=A0ABX0LBA9_9BURK|nr:hypothetical protein [Massilia rubra]NHZ32156.1 hypothetical protein [Massilia rubra]